MGPGNSVTVPVRSGQTADCLPPASYQHTPNDGERCVCQCSKVRKGRWGRVAADVKLRVVKSLTTTASFSSLT